MIIVVSYEHYIARDALILPAELLEQWESNYKKQNTGIIEQIRAKYA